MQYSDSPLILDPFFYVDYNGSNDFPKQDAIRADEAKGISTVLILDANICMRLRNYAQGEKDKKRKEEARLFLLQVQRAIVDVVPLLGCIELAATRESIQVDQDLLLGLVGAAHSALSQSEHDLLYERPVSIGNVPDVSFTTNLLHELYPILRYFYCCFLKITSLRIGSKKNLKNKASAVYKWRGAISINVFGQRSCSVPGREGGAASRSFRPASLCNYEANSRPTN